MVTALASVAIVQAAKEIVEIGPPKENPYMEYTDPLASLSKFALPIKNPNECFGANFEIFDQLTSPEWQLCQTEGKVKKTRFDSDGIPEEYEVDGDLLHMCSTERPDQLLLRLVINDV